MNNEPVAYRYEDKNNPLVFYFTTRKDKTENPDAIEIPLYAHPVKTLTDEEIMELWYPLDLHDEAWVDDAVLREFARAILRKAQEK